MLSGELIDPIDLILVLAACSLLAGLTYFHKILDLKGSVLGFIMGLLIGLMGHLFWLLLLLLFLGTAFAATRYKYALKSERQVAEPDKGRRGFSSVMANGWVPMVVAMLSYPNPWWGYFPKGIAALLFLSSISSAAADTIASELGVLSDKAYLITTFKGVRPGVNGGISVLGTSAALAAAIYTSTVGWAVLYPTGQLSNFPLHYILIPIVMGFAGCQIDSLLGATFENRGILNKDRVNVLSIGAATMLALALIMFMGA